MKRIPLEFRLPICPSNSIQVWSSNRICIKGSHSQAKWSNLYIFDLNSLCAALGMSMGIWDYINTHEMLRPHPFRITESWRLRLTQSQLPFAVTKIYLHFRLNAFLFYFYRPTWLLLFADTHMTKLTHTRREGTCFAFGNRLVLRSRKWL